MSQMGTITAVCISEKQGIPRPKVEVGRLLINQGFVGNRLSRGGDRQVCLFDEETYETLRSEGANVDAGTFGENITTSGIEYSGVNAGDLLQLGDAAIIEITMARKPCSNLTQFDSRLPGLIVGRSGWMAKVIQSGNVKTGDSIAIQVAASSCV